MALRRFACLACLAPLILACLAPSASCDEAPDDYSLSVRVDETKVGIVSGNLSFAVTRAWPRALFWHTLDPFSPTFDIGFPRMYLFNDTDGDGRFSPSEAKYTVYLDSKRVAWNLSSVQSDFSQEMGEFAMFHMSTCAGAYDSSSETVPAVNSWANISFRFCVAENRTSIETLSGRYAVSGKTEVSVSMTLEVVNGTDCDGVAVERFLQGGGTTNMFEILEDGPDGGVSAVLPSRVDETLQGDGFVRPLNGTASSVQCVDFSKEDGTVQAFLSWGSSACSEATDLSATFPVNSSCYTNGAGLLLHSVFELANGSAEFSHISVFGLVESGFVGRMTDWAREYSSALAVISVAATMTAVVGVHVALRRRRLRLEEKESVPADKDR